MRIMFHSGKSSRILQEITSNFKERAKFRTRKKTVVSLKFSKIMNANSEQKISHVYMEVYVTADLYQARLASHTDVLRGSSRVPTPRTSADCSGKKRGPIRADFQFWEVHFGS